ncbi:hypothetical protein [Methanothermococcus okinawensis]|uniref:hypothetical protein n=1 Tax=Methanothermococcus okinawensis TaxID=155863 RepID=UPI00064E811C|nr:hypothetical protein [Methanothermococcus okinawensis]
MEKAEVSDEIKQQWLKNRLTRLCHRNPQLLPYYIQIVSNPGVLRKLYSLIEVESLENGDSK